ncbi:MAG: glycosyltransferase [Roseateles sp.]|uniref:glycosyltransferase n=1 Tax=Roseateles sp. TaxID=1971397 RepID=UPI004036DC87
MLVLNPYFLPSSKGGGSVTAVVSLVAHLKNDFEFVVAASAHDLHTAEPFADTARLDAQQKIGIKLHHLPRGLAAFRHMDELLRQPWDLIYLNSILSPVFTALPLLLRRLRLPDLPVLLAPRGELMRGALMQRRTKKLIYLRLMRGLGLFRRLQFHATSETEQQAVRDFGFSPVHLVADLPPRLRALPQPHCPASSAPLKIVFLSRIEAKKNLLFALETLAQVKVPVALDIVGPVGDADYWAACRDAMARLPAWVQAHYLGPIDPGQVVGTLAKYELFFLPTQAENNGYVIHEALLAGCSLLISDQTPWRQLAAAGVGVDLPLQVPQFVQAVDAFAALPAGDRLAQRQRAQAFGAARLDAEADIAAMGALLAQAASAHR